MIKFLSLLIVVFPLLLVAKETKKVVRERMYPAYNETFYVLRSDTGVKHGPYKAEVAGKLILSGYYKMGKPDSLWTQFNFKGIIRAQGYYRGDKRDSIWSFFNNNGQLEQKIDFTLGEVLYYQTAFAKHPFMIISKTDTLMSILERPPLFIGGMSRFQDYVSDELRIPLHKPEEKVTGTVYVSFTIDSLGKTSNHRILKGIGQSCNQEALRVIKSIPDEWMPGALNDKFVTVDYIVPVQFDSRVPMDTFDATDKDLNIRIGGR